MARREGKAAENHVVDWLFKNSNDFERRASQGRTPLHDGRRNVLPPGLYKAWIVTSLSALPNGTRFPDKTRKVSRHYITPCFVKTVYLTAYPPTPAQVAEVPLSPDRQTLQCCWDLEIGSGKRGRDAGAQTRAELLLERPWPPDERRVLRRPQIPRGW